MKQLKSTISKTKYLALAILVAFSFSCSPEDGADGEQGPAGLDGNANVIDSGWFQIQFDDVNAADDAGTMQIKNSTIDNYINNGGTLLMYYKNATATGEFVIYPLPLGEEISYLIANVPSQGFENALAIFIDAPSVSNLENNPQFTFKYIIIPPNTSAKTTVDYSKMTYNEVTAHFELKK